MSGVVLNAAFFALARALMGWLPVAPQGAFPALSVIVIAVATISAILTILYAFQQDDWRSLLSFSSAENASIAVVGARRGDAVPQLGHERSRRPRMDGGAAPSRRSRAGEGSAVPGRGRNERASTGSYHIAYAGAGRHWFFGVGALLAAMSLAAMPPTAGFVSEWFVFQTVFQGFHLPYLGGRLVLALTGAGLALTAAVAFATFVKVVGHQRPGREAASQRLPSNAPMSSRWASLAFSFLRSAPACRSGFRARRRDGGHFGSGRVRGCTAGCCSSR